MGGGSIKFIQRSAARDVGVLVENATMLQMCAELGFHTLDMGSDIRRLVLDIESGCERAGLSGAPFKNGDRSRMARLAAIDALLTVHVARAGGGEMSGLQAAKRLRRGDASCRGDSASRLFCCGA
jgi:hypothetical protein